jgi:hypothetical protein
MKNPTPLGGALLAAGLLLPAPVLAIGIYEKDDFTLGVSLRMQPRVEVSNVGGNWLRDFMVRRTRMNVSGKMNSAQYKLEWKIDGTDQIGSTPTAAVENAYVQYPLGKGVEVRAGLYDVPYSRDRLTSDSKQLAVDRGAVSNVPDAFGLADNGTGIQLMGKVNGGRAEYAVGVFDNRRIAGAFQDIPMVVGRLDLNFGSTQNIFMDAHFGEDRWYSLGVNGSYQGEIQDASGASDGANAAAGIDGMIDVPAGAGRLFVRSEFNTVRITDPTGGDAVETRVWMVGAGLLILDQRLQPVVRFDEIRRDDAVGGGVVDITYFGANLYQKGHNLKLQADVRFESGTGESVDGGRLQAQIDF